MASRADQLASSINFSKFGKATELKNRIWFTIGALIVFRFLSFVPLPGVDPVALSRLYSQAASGGILDIFNTFSGGSLERMSIIALGVMPYITASIVVQLAAALAPSLAALKKEGESGRKKLNQYTRYGTVLLTAIQGYFIAVGLETLGQSQGIAAVVAHIRALPGCAELDVKYSSAAAMPFQRLKVRLKKEIVTMKVPGVDPAREVGAYVAPADWNAVIDDPDTIVIDTRNDFEVGYGSFAGAVNPQTKSFGDFPGWWRDHAADFAGKRVAMFCTGGIRCEKSTNYLLGQGVEDVFHLKGGILKYLEDMPADQSLWQGECFVFDGRVSVGHGLVEGPHEMCHACRRPILPEDKERPEYEAGVSCHLCIEDYDDDRRERFRERQRQIALARSRGDRHLGPRGD